MFGMLKNSSLSAALENADLEGGENVSDVEIAEGATDLAEGSAEVDQEVAAIESLNLAIEEAEEGAEELEGNAEVLQESVDSGEGVSEDAAALATECMRNVMRRLQLPQRQVVPSLEAFGSKNTRLAVTRVALEGFSDTIKSIWERIKKGIKLVWQKITDFFAKFFDNTEKLTKQATALKKKAASLGSEIKEKQIKSKYVSKSFAADNKVTAAGVVKILNNHKIISSSFVSNMNGMSTLVGLANKMAGGSGPDEAAVAKAVVSFWQDGLGGADLVKRETVKDGDKDKDVISAGPFLDNSVLQVGIATSKDGSFEDLTTEVKANEKKNVSETSDTLKKDEILSVLAAVLTLATSTEEFKKQKSKIDGVQKALMGAADAALKVADKVTDTSEDNDKIKSGLAVARRLVTKLSAANSRLITLLPAWNVRAGKAALTYVSMSINAHGAPKE